MATDREHNLKKVLIISSSPNIDGLTAACAQAAEKGAQRAGADAMAVSLNKMDIKSCRACDNGWGICRKEHICIIKDDFEKIRKMIDECNTLVMITPVYWGEMSEPAKCFFDRLRRCEAPKNFWSGESESVLHDKNTVLVAAAGGSGNGTLTCLTQMENIIKHIGGKIFDRITATRFNRRYKLTTIEEAGYESVDPEVKE